MKLLIAAITLLLVTLLLLQWRDWPPPLPEPPGTPSQAELPNGAARPKGTLEPLPPLEEYASIIERPLFLPDRRPPEEAPDQPDVAPPEEPTDLAGVDLNAVMITSKVISAWLRAPSSQELVRLRIGDDFEGWTVSRIEPDRLVLERQGEVDELLLRDYANAPPPIPPTPRAAPRPRRSGSDQASSGAGETDQPQTTKQPSRSPSAGAPPANGEREAPAGASRMATTSNAQADNRDRRTR